MEVTLDEARAVPSGIDYLGDKFEEVQEILSLKNPIREGFAPDGMKRVSTGRNRGCPVRDKIN